MKDREPRGIPPQYRPEDLGIDPFELCFFSLIRAIPKGVPAGVVLAVLAYAASLYTPESKLTQLPQVETSAVSPEPASPIILGRAQRAQNMLDQLRNPSGLSFQEVMSLLGHSVGRIVDYSYEPRWGIVGSEGLYERAYSSAEDTWVVFEMGKWLGVGRIYAGERVGWDAEIDVQTGRVVDRFGLLLPNDPESDNLTFIRLGRRTDDAWEQFVKQTHPQPSFSVYLPVMRQLPDGSIVYDEKKKIIGPSDADKARANSK